MIDPRSGLDAARDVLLEEGQIKAVEQPGTLSAASVLDATDCVVCPGFIDLHVHLREPGQTWKETIASGTAAAAAGGFTAIAAMPNTVPVNDSVATLQWMLSADRGPKTRLYAMPAVTLGSLGETLTDFEALAAEGAVGFTDDGKPVLDPGVMREALLRAGRLGLVISQHAEDTRMSPSSGVNAGALAFRMGLRGMSVEAEALIVERDIELVRDILKKDGIRARLHVQHVSTGRAIEAVRRAKQDGLDVTCEATPHHFTLTEEALADFNTNAKMNPPLRAEGDRQAIIAGLLDGTVDCLATDHAPHARHEKEVEFERAPNGITGLETALGLALRVLHKQHGMPLARLIACMSATPARIAKLSAGGSLAVGAAADVTIFSPTAAWRYEAAQSRSRSKNSPFDGAPMLGRVRHVLLAGKPIYQQS